MEWVETSRFERFGMLQVSRLAASIQPSATLAAAARAKQLQASGVRIRDFSLGEPDFPTPEPVCEAARQAMVAGKTRYTQASGTPELRAAVASHYRATYGLAVTPEQVLISNGAKHSLHNALSASLNPGDEVIIPTPYWVSYSDLVAMTGAVPVLVPTNMEDGFRLNPQALRAAITPRTKLLLLNAPSNPTGAVYSRAQLEALAKVVLEADLSVISDEIYEQLMFDGREPVCFATLHPDLPARTLTVSGVSKTYAMTGWRIGWTVGPASLIKAMGNVQSQQTSNPCSISQAAAVAAITGDQQCVEMMRNTFQQRRDLVCRLLNAIPGITCPIPDGAFYAFFNITGLFGKTVAGKLITNSVSFCDGALETAHVCLVPGSAFGAEGFARLSFATSPEEIEAGVAQLAEWLRQG